MMSWTRRLVTIIWSVSLIAAMGTARAQPHQPDNHELRVRVGQFTPDGDSEYWNEKARDFDGGPGDFEDASFGVDYVFHLSGRQGLMVSVDHFEGSSFQRYREFVDDSGDDIFHRANLDITSVTAGWVLRLAGRRAPVSPYVGLGGGLYSWELIESGDFIDFRGDPLEIFSGTFSSQQEALGGYLLAGVDIRLPGSWSLFAEGRWQEVDDELEGDFDGFGTLDLSGVAVNAGVAIRF